MTMASVPAPADRDVATAAIGQHLITAAMGGIYAWFMLWTYQELSKLWGYLGFWYQPQPAWITASTIGAAALLGLLLPIGNWTIVGFAKWVLYFILFIPALMIPPQQGVLTSSELLLLEMLTWASAAALILLLRDGKPFPTIRLSPTVLWNSVIVCWLVGNGAVIWVFGNTMSLAGLDQVYEQRAASATAGGAVMGYVTGTLSGAINPFLLVMGFARKKPFPIALGLVGQLVIYATLAGKVVLGSTLLTVGAFLAFRHGRVVFARIHAAVLGFAVLGPFVSAPQALAGGLASTISDLIYFRILLLPGVLVGVYSDFFQRYPITHLSHSLIGRPFSAYPYGSESVGQVIGRYVTPSTGAANNYNANFIAADGIAGFSTWGVPVIFAIVAIWFWIMSRAVGQTDRPIACAMLMPFIVSLADASLFTALLTGGGAVATLLLYLNRSAEQRDSGDPSTRSPAFPSDFRTV